METKVDSGTVFDVDFGRRGDKGNFLAFEYPNVHSVSITRDTNTRDSTEILEKIRDAL